MLYTALLASLLPGCTTAATRSPVDVVQGAGPASAANPVAALTRRLRDRIGQVHGARVGVAYVSLGRPDSLFIDADSVFHAASTMKVPVMIELMRRVDDGRLRLDQMIPLVNRFSSIVDGSPFSLDAADDSDPTLYAKVGTGVQLDELMERMITHSSNLATNVLIELVTADSVRATTNALQAPGMRVLRGVEDTKAFEKGLSNTTTARALATLMVAIESGGAGSPTSTSHMRDILLRQAFDDEIPAGLPPGTLVAHKTGSITAILHDAAIVYPTGRPPYVLVVLTGAIPDPAVARLLIADIAREIHAFDGAQAAAGGS